jgi:hypothetical protein
MDFLLSSIFKSWKTTLAGVISVAVFVAAKYGYHITPGQADALLVVALMAVAFFSKDATLKEVNQGE